MELLFIVMPRACSSSLESMYLQGGGWYGRACPSGSNNNFCSAAVARNRGQIVCAPDLARQARVDEAIGSYQMVAQRRLPMVHMRQYAHVADTILIEVG